jgi:predicted Zn-dependent protease
MQFRQGMRHRALESLGAATNEKHSNIPTGVSLYAAMLNFAEGRLEEANRINDALLERQPENSIALNLRAAILVTRGEVRAGEELLKYLLRKDPTFKPARYNLAEVYASTQRFRLAQSELASLLAENPNDIRALLQSARLARSLGDFAEAESNLKHIVNSDNTAIVPAKELVELYLQLNRSADAVAVASSLTRTIPSSSTAYELLAQVQLERDDRAAAKNSLAKAMELAGHDARRLISVAMRQSQAGEFKDAEISLRRALINQPDDLDARVQLAIALFRQGNYKAAREEIGKVIDEDPTNVLATSLLGDIHMAHQEFSEAAANYEAALDIVVLPELIVSLFEARTYAGEPDYALAELTSAANEFPNDPLIARTLAERLHQLDRQHEAKERYLQLIAITPDDPYAHNNLANLLLKFDN